MIHLVVVIACCHLARKVSSSVQTVTTQLVTIAQGTTCCSGTSIQARRLGYAIIALNYFNDTCMMQNRVAYRIQGGSFYSCR